MAYRHRDSNGWIVGGVMVMDLTTAVAMDGLSAMRWQWRGDGDGCCNNNGDERRIGNGLTMDGSLAA